MRKVLVIIAATVGLLLPFIAVSTVGAASFRSGNDVTIGKGEVVDSTVFAAGQSVEIAGTVNGDVFCAGSNVTVSGIVHGDVICAGQTVNVSGTVDGDVRLAGSAVNLSANVAGNASLAGSSVTLQSDGSVRDLHAAGASVLVNGAVARDVDAAGQSLDINGKVGRNVTASSEHVSFGAKSTTGGAVSYTSYNELNRADGAVITGQIQRHDPPKDRDNGWKDNWALDAAPFVIGSMLFTALVLVAIAPRFFYSLSERGMREPGWSVLAGLGLWIVTPLLMIVAFVTMIGWPVGVMILLGLILVCMLSGPVAAFWLGRMILRGKTNNAFYYMLLGVAILAILYFIPVINILSMLVAGIFGAGMVVMELLRRTPRPVYELAAPARRSRK